MQESWTIQRACAPLRHGFRVPPAVHDPWHLAHARGQGVRRERQRQEQENNKTRTEQTQATIR